MDQTRIAEPHIACIDGSDADSGTAIEIAIAIIKTGRAILYSTDFRTDVSRELGYNLMLRLPGTHFIYEPCLITEYREIWHFYRKLANRIDKGIHYLQSGGQFNEKLALGEGV